MVRIKKKFSFLRVSEVWFKYKYNFTDLAGLTAFLHIKNYSGKILGIKQLSFTVENKLNIPDEEIFLNFSKTVKTEIKQVEKLNVNCFFHSDIKGFIEFYNKFAAMRNIDLCSENRLAEMGRYLQLSYAVYNNQTVAAHSYMVDEESGIVRLMHSASERLNENYDKQLSGKINKLLHYTDMLNFKKAGFAIYDFGGYTNNTEDKGLQGINTFKLSFGGKKVECINYSSYSYYIFKKMAAMLGLLGKG